LLLHHRAVTYKFHQLVVICFLRCSISVSLVCHTIQQVLFNWQFSESLNHLHYNLFKLASQIFRLARMALLTWQRSCLKLQISMFRYWIPWLVNRQLPPRIYKFKNHQMKWNGQKSLQFLSLVTIVANKLSRNTIFCLQ